MCQCKPQETRRGVWDSTSRGLVALERVGGNEGECGAGVDDTGGFGEDVRGSAEADLLVDAPEFLRRIDCRDWSKNVVTGETVLIRSRDPVESGLRAVNRTDELARVGAAEGDLAVAVRPDHQRGRAAKVEIATIPWVGCDDAPAPEERVRCGGHAGAFASSLGRRTRL